MSFIDEFDDFLDDTVTVAPKTGRDGYGRDTYGTAVSYRCRVKQQPMHVRSNTGEEVASRSQVLFDGSPVIGPDDRITLPDGTTPRIISVSRTPDDTGTRTVRVYT